MASIFKTFQYSVKHWYLPLVLGIINLLFGLYIFTTPIETYVTLSFLFSISFVVSGILDTIFSIQNHKTLDGWGWYLTGGLLSLAMGIYLIIHPAITIAILPFVVGITALFRSFQLLGFAFDLKEDRNLSWGNIAIISVLGIVFSFLLLANPIFSGISIVVLTAMSFISIGIASIILALNLKKIKDYPSKISEELKNKIENIEKEIKSIK